MPSGPLSEAELQALVRQAQEGNTRAFEALYDHYFLPVYRYTAFRTSAEVAEDLVADVFVKVWEKLHTYKVQTGVPFGAWLFRIARHAIIDEYRRQHVQTTEDVSEELADPDLLNKADAALHRNDVLRVVRGALDLLPRRYREILVLSYVAELSHQEVARALRMTEGAVRILKFRALKKLEGFLPPDMKEKA